MASKLAAVFALLLGGAAVVGSAAASPPQGTEPIPDITLHAGSTRAGAVDLSLFFERPSSGPLEFAPVAVPLANDSADVLVLLRVAGSWLDVIAPDPALTGQRAFQIEACTAAPAMRECSTSNTFSVNVEPPAFGRPDLNPEGYSIIASTRLDATVEGDSIGVQVEVPAGSEFQAPPAWFLDGTPLGEGASVTFSALKPGRHTLEARFETADGPVVLHREFQTALAPTRDSWGSVFVGVAGFAAAGAVIGMGASARLRRPLVLLAVGAIHSRLSKSEMLAHFHRGALHQAIKENPGIHFSELRRKTGIASGTAVYHLHALEMGGYIRAAPTGAFTRYFVTDQSLAEDTYGLSPADAAVLKVVVDRPGISLAELATSLDRSLGTMSGTVSRLSQLGYVTTRRSLRRRLVYPRPDRPGEGTGSSPPRAGSHG